MPSAADDALVIDVELARADFTLAAEVTLAPHGITAVFGHSGAGKSTLLRTLAGLERAARGRIIYRGEVWQDSAAGIGVPPHRRGIGYVFQDAQLLAFLDVRGNLGYAARRAPPTANGPAFDDVVAAFDLAALLGRPVRVLSGGERQRVAIARALLTRPRLLLMDEPLSANDIGRKADLLPYVRELPRRFGVPVIYVSHAMDEVAYIADRLLVLGAGRVLAHGPLDTVLERLDLGPATGRFEAGTVLNGRVVRHDDAFQLTVVALGRQTMVIPRVTAAAGDAIKLRVRARDVALAIERPRGISIRNVLDGTLIDIVEEPATAYAEVLVDVGAAHVRARLTRAAAAELALVRGCAVFALIKSVSVDDRLVLGRAGDAELHG
ncbi:MAG: molybdenum ABC transporter ATP-binding protein [Gammaproteobacteria bacterium]